MPPTFTGALQPKKKSELQEIATALRLSDQGTKDELQARIKKHLDTNQSSLEDDPTFGGLFGRRKRSAQPQQGLPSSRFAPPEPPSLKPNSRRSSLGRRITALDPVRESTPVSDLRDVSMFLKRPTSPITSTPNQSPRQFDDTTPSSLPPLPPSPSASLIEHIRVSPSTNVITEQIKQSDMLQNSRETLIRVRHFLSNSQTLWSLSAVLELLYILATVIPWKHIQLPNSNSFYSVSIAYPPMHTFQTFAFWMTLLQWAIPTLIIPAVVGNVVSFNPVSSPLHISTGSPIPPFDPLTASIARLAAQVGYPFPLLEHNTQISGLDVLGFKWRVLSASISLAFSFAEAIADAPHIFAKTLVFERKYDRLSGINPIEDKTSNWKALLGAEDVNEKHQ
ncbi:hypothetical protein BDZ94DRAFT_1265994 [Collybia nuda]|uniref:SAP domain-containing protein n=1 Tax=Collybia nuda TaxID=64659 RepID=A0A9P5Y3D9_9AGAR|nr:hypothetical protein BDZ94DRAFT_1265994 [Collybia nuda]